MQQQKLVPWCRACQRQLVYCADCGSQDLGIGLEPLEPLQPPTAPTPYRKTPETFLAFLRQPGARWRHTVEQKPASGVQYLEIRFHKATPIDEARAVARLATESDWMPVFANYRLSAGPLEIMHIQFIAEV